MGKVFYPDFFNDVFGPVMQSGSSSNFAGNSRVGWAASFTVKGELRRVTIAFNPNDKSQIRGLGNMMEDRAFLGGAQKFRPDDERLFRAHELAREKGISYEFTVLDQDNGYPDSVRFDLESRAGEKGELIGASVGGGMIKVYEINHFPLLWQGDSHALLVRGRNNFTAVEGLIKELEDAVLASETVKSEAGEEAYYLELSSLPKDGSLSIFPAADWVLIPALLPVTSFNGRGKQLFTTVDEWISAAEERGISFVETAIEYEKIFSGWSDRAVWDYFEYIRAVLLNQIHSLEDRGIDPVPDTPLLPVYGKFWNRYKKQGRVLEDPLTSKILDYAFSVNAKIPGVKIVPGPMGTGGGYLFSALEAVREARGFSRRKQLEGLVVAAGLGAIAYTLCRATGVSGCVGESGICCAMASGAITWMAGGTGREVQNAASMALQANIGIPCDPIPGGLEFPCLTRTVRAAVTAPLYADMALAGIDPLIPYHEMLVLIERIRSLHGDILNGPDCGTNCTATAERCRRFLSGEVMEGKLKWEAPGTEQ
ncbi:MAG: L-serine ammonia-lyase, iron-sulfur-dependent, subunit alpha [Treponema sp.]|jgi:L-serine dehydratase|nr:L-serine ammonia-lyase, iron-sulfur-dependent, subunit alpha [Treponema sp.]